LAQVLTKGNFRSWVVGRRQRSLLAVASETFGRMTNGNYGFTEDFAVFDRIAGQARDPKTLSGGETFLASMALALTLVEMASRSGKRQQALFLDEGFASLDLDADSLDEAVDVLSEQTTGGRLVAVITHLRAVTETMPDVWWISKDATGTSDLRVLDAAGREVLLADDAASRLVL
jgi:exonuclease SbcC